MPSGVLLNTLWARRTSFAGDRKSSELLSFLIWRAAAPYLRLLREWVVRGALHDTYGEFMIREQRFESESEAAARRRRRQQQQQQRSGRSAESGEFGDAATRGSDAADAAYWDERYAIVAVENIPVFLRQSAPLVLATGKYLNTARQYSAPPPPQSNQRDAGDYGDNDGAGNVDADAAAAAAAAWAEEEAISAALLNASIEFTIDERNFARVIENAHALASRKLVIMIIIIIIIIKYFLLLFFNLSCIY